MGERLTYSSVQVFAFAPSQAQPFTFQPVLDGAVYTVTAPWNLFGQRYYVTVRTLQGARVCTVPLIGSPNDYDINILGGYFTALLVFRADQQQFQVLTGPLEAAA
jgi:hypothetical protein